MPHFTSSQKKKNVLRMVRSAVVVASVIFSAPEAFATLLNNVHDTAIIHTVQGSDKFYEKKQKRLVRFHLSPFFQHAGRARNSGGRAIPLGERQGKWDMSGLFFGFQAAPNQKMETAYPNLFAAATELNKLVTAGSLSPDYAVTTGGVDGVTPSGASQKLGDNAGETAFDPAYDVLTTFTAVNVQHEELGIRGQLSYDFGWGLGVTVKGGLVDYKERPAFNYSSATPDQKLIPQDTWTTLTHLLFTPAAAQNIFGDIGLDIGEVRETCFEDTHLQFNWNYPWEIREKGEVTVVMIPYIAAGVWVPTGKTKNQDRAFSIDTGNGGFYGLTIDASLSFDFPKLIQTNFGCGALISSSKDFANYRVPSSNLMAGSTTAYNPIEQSGFYPWKTSISKTPGTTWYANASFKADGFNGALSLYFDYIYTYHEHDSIVLKEPTKTRADSFAQGVSVLEQQSMWKSQIMNVGLGYAINEHLSFGGSVQALIGGVQVFKTTTALGSMTLTW